MFTGMAKPPEKRTLVEWGKEKLKQSFTFSGAEDVWREKHAKEIQELNAINESLSPEDRAKAMEKLDKDIAVAAKVKVMGNYGAAALVTGTITYGGFLVGSEKVRKWTGEKVPFIGKDLEKFGQGGASFLKNLGERMRNLRKKKGPFVPFGLITDVYNDIHLDAVDLLNRGHPFEDVVGQKDFFIGRLNTEIGKMESEDLIHVFVSKAQKRNAWQPLILDQNAGKIIGYSRRGMDSDMESMEVLLEKGLVSKHDVKKGLVAYVPTAKFIDFVKRALAQK